MMIDAIAFTLFLMTWLKPDEDISDLTPKHLADLRKKWVNEFLPSLSDPHSGDCTKMPWSCTRCSTERLMLEAKLIMMQVV